METPQSILIIEDELFQSKTLSMILEKQGYQVITAATGDEACSYLDNHHYDLTILDFHIGNINGLDLITRLNNCDPGMHILILTGGISLENSQEAVRRGAADILFKPVTPPELLEKVSLIFSNKSTLDELIGRKS